MYGSDQTDLLVKYYDAAFAISSDAEISWYLNKVRRFGGPVLDLACGTGRLALQLAKEGFQVTAMDQSAGMLTSLRGNWIFSPLRSGTGSTLSIKR
jgi:2-polyprenyl-3-methyl-5-hydroxy-6-metoxy-1,4-benzoquinol methylase